MPSGKKCHELDEGLALLNKNSGEVVLAVRQGDEIVELGKISNGKLQPTQLLGEGDALGEVVDGYQFAKTKDGKFGFRVAEGAGKSIDDLAALVDDNRKALFKGDLSDEAFRLKISEAPELVDSWKVLENNPILRKKPENLENISKWLDEGIEPQKLTDGIGKSKSKQNLIDQLGTAKSKLHAQVLIKDYDNIPGVVKGRYTPNGSTLADKADLPSGWADDFDLPVDEAQNFTGKIEALELKPGDRIFRVSGDDGVSGPYWTRTKPEQLEDVIGGTAVKPAWNNFQYISEYVVPEGVTIKSWVGKTARQRVGNVPSNYYLRGGDEQLFISFIKNQDSNFSKTVKTVKTEW